MKWLFLLGLLAVSSVWASPNAAKENEGEKVALNERSKRDVADGEGNAERIRHIRKKRDAGESGESSELDLDVDINVGGSRGKSDIDIKVNVGSANGEKNKNEKELGKTDPCDCVGQLSELAHSLDQHLGSLIESLGALKEKGEANNGTAAARASSSTLAVVQSLKGDISGTVRSLTRYWRYVCGYIYYYNYYYSQFYQVFRCTWRNYRKRRDIASESTTEPLSEPEPELMLSEENGIPICIVGDLVDIMNGIANETSNAVALTDQAVNDSSITADLLSDLDELIESLKNQRELAGDMKKEIGELPC